METVWKIKLSLGLKMANFLEKKKSGQSFIVVVKLPKIWLLMD